MCKAETISPVHKLAQYGKKQTEQAETLKNEIKTKVQESRDTLKGRQKNKALSKHLALEMVNKVPSSKLKKAYWNTYYCSENIEYKANEKEVNSHYCKNRFCLVCNRIRMGINISEFLPIVASWNEIGFVTLSTVNCIEGQIRNQITEYMKVLELIKKQWNRNRKLELLESGYSPAEYQNLKANTPEICLFQAVVKLEVTYNSVQDTFHPHLHCLVNGYLQSEFLYNEWIKKMEKRGMNINIKGQDIRPANSETVVETMKYFTKILQKDKNGKLYFPPEQVDIILSELYKVPLIRCIGISRKERNYFKKKFSEYSRIKVDLGTENKVYKWIPQIYNWVNELTGEMLCDTEIPIIVENFIKGRAKVISIKDTFG